jgi:hypothetical protein
VSTGDVVSDDVVREVAAFLTDAARGGVSIRTVLHVIDHHVDQGVAVDVLLAAAARARESVGERHRGVVTEYEQAIRERFDARR